MGVVEIVVLIVAVGLIAMALTRLVLGRPNRRDRL